VHDVSAIATGSGARSNSEILAELRAPVGSVIDMNVRAVRMNYHAQLAHLVDETAAFEFMEVFGWSF